MTSLSFLLVNVFTTRVHWQNLLIALATTTANIITTTITTTTSRRGSPILLLLLSVSSSVVPFETSTLTDAVVDKGQN